jgi:MFS family permease
MSKPLLTPVNHAALLVGGGLLSLLPLYCFLLVGDLAWSLKERAVQELVKAQLREYSHDPVLLNILFGVLPALIALFAAPAVGAWSDRTRTRFGRRMPFLLALTPLLAGSLVLLAFSQPLADYVLRTAGADPSQRDRIVVSCMGALWVVFDLFSIVINAVFIALVNDTVPREVLGRFFAFFRIVSLAAGAAFFFLVFRNDVPAVASKAMLAIAAIFGGGFLLLCGGVREPDYPPPTPEKRRLLGRLRAEREGAPWFFILLFTAVGMAIICVLPVNINGYNAMAQFNVDRSSYGQAIAFTYCISILLAWPLGWLADRVHPMRIGLVTLALYAIGMLLAWMFVSSRESYLFWLVVHGVLAGVFLTGTASLLPLVLPRERFSELAAFSASVTAILAMLLAAGTGLVLSWSGKDFRLIFLVSGLTATFAVVLWACAMNAHERRAGSLRSYGSG